MDVLFLTALAKYFPPVGVILFLPILGIRKKKIITATILQPGWRSGHRNKNFSKSSKHFDQKKKKKHTLQPATSGIPQLSWQPAWHQHL